MAKNYLDINGLGLFNERYLSLNNAISEDEKVLYIDNSGVLYVEKTVFIQGSSSYPNMGDILIDNSLFFLEPGKTFLVIENHEYGDFIYINSTGTYSSKNTNCFLYIKNGHLYFREKNNKTIILHGFVTYISKKYNN